MLIEGRGLRKTFDLGRGRLLHALAGVDIGVAAGSVFALVGESGCGKSTLGRCLLRLMRPDGGQVLFEGRDITRMSQRALRPLRRRMQIVLQDPASSLDPRLTVARSIAEPLAVHGIGASRAERHARAVALLEQTGLDASHADRYPHELSAGQRQRVCIARALAVEPRFVVCDEPVSALDVSVQAQVLELLLALRSSLELALLFISHDMRVVHHVADEVAVMFFGRIVEQGSARALLERPQHPYSRALSAAALDESLGVAPATSDNGGAVAFARDSGAARTEGGCAYRARCPIYQRERVEECELEVPSLQRVAGLADDAVAHRVACHVVAASSPPQDDTVAGGG